MLRFKKQRLTIHIVKIVTLISAGYCPKFSPVLSCFVDTWSYPVTTLTFNHIPITCRTPVVFSHHLLMCYSSTRTDHLAVQLFILEDVGSLTLHLPCPWNGSKYLESKCKHSSGAISNKYHEMFSKVIKEDSLKQINDAIQLGATVHVHNGFLQRNSFVAQSEYLVAFTWGEGDIPKEGGTLDTWTKCKGRKVHIPLDSLQLDVEVKSSTRKRKSDVPHLKQSKLQLQI